MNKLVIIPMVIALYISMIIAIYKGLIYKERFLITWGCVGIIILTTAYYIIIKRNKNKSWYQKEIVWRHILAVGFVLYLYNIIIKILWKIEPGIKKGMYYEPTKNYIVGLIIMLILLIYIWVVNKIRKKYTNLSCPNCGAPIIKNDTKYNCYEKECGYNYQRDIAGKEISESFLEKLIGEKVKKQRLEYILSQKLIMNKKLKVE